MPQFSLINNNGKQYGGQYVAVKSFSDREVISHGKQPASVLKEANEKGYAEPVLLFIPETNMVHIY